MRDVKYKLVLLNMAVCLALFAPRSSAAQTIQAGPGYAASISLYNAGGALSHLSDGDIIAFTNDFVNGPALYRIDANGDGVPSGGVKLLKQFDSSNFPDFVQVSPGGTFALAGVGGSSDDVFRIDLTNDSVQPYLTIPGNFDLVFIDDTRAYVSSNPQGFNPSGPNEISLLTLSNTPSLTPVVRIFGTPSGPIARNIAGDLYYVKGTFTFPAPPVSSKILRFSAAALAGVEERCAARRRCAQRQRAVSLTGDDVDCVGCDDTEGVFDPRRSRQLPLPDARRRQDCRRPTPKAVVVQNANGGSGQSISSRGCSSAEVDRFP